MYVYFERKQRIRINSADEGELPYTQFVFPESHDPFYDSRHQPLAERPRYIAADFLNVQMVYFAARKISADGTTEKLQYKTSFREDQITINERFESQFRYIFDLQGVQPGDEIEVYYKYEVPYQFNSFFFKEHRIFYHGKYPIQLQRIEIAVPEQVSSQIVGRNPDNSFVESKRNHYVWKHEDLPGCIEEVGIRPSIDLPHLVVSFFTGSPVSRLNNNLVYEDFPSHYLREMLTHRERNTLWLRRIARGDSERDAQSVHIHEFIDETTAGIPRYRAAWRMDRLHSRISNEFEYQWDDAYFARDDLSLEKMGDQVAEKRLRETSRYNLYARLINSLGEKYFTTYLLDARIGQLSENYSSNVLFSDFAFAVPDDDYLSIYYPKSDVYGYEPNEFPFYLAGSPAYFVNYDQLVTSADYSPATIQLPGQVKDNNRQTLIMAKISTETAEMIGEITVDLAGQFSTLTRSLYDYGKVDSSINPLYGLMPLHGLNAEYDDPQQMEAEMYAPYSRKYALKFEGQANIDNASGGSAIELPLTGWFNFVTWPNFDGENRVLPFYIDFEGNDFTRIVVEFDREVLLENPEQLSFHRENRFGSVGVKFVQESANRISIEAYFSQFGQRVEPEKANLIAELYEAVSELNNTVVKLNWAE